jgi:hypothetical protein
MEIKKYVEIIDTKTNKTEIIKPSENTFYLLDEEKEIYYYNDFGYVKLVKILATSDNILDLAREGDLVRDHSDIYELFEVNEELVFYPDKEQKNITMLYKKVGNNFIGYEVN